MDDVPHNSQEGCEASLVACVFLSDEAATKSTGLKKVAQNVMF